MYRIKKILFRIYEDNEKYINEIEKQIEIWIAETPHRKEIIIKEVENEKEARKIFAEEKEKINKTAYNIKEKCIIGEEVILTEIEKDGIFKGLDYTEPIENYIKLK